MTVECNFPLLYDYSYLLFQQQNKSLEKLFLIFLPSFPPQDSTRTFFLSLSLQKEICLLNVPTLARGRV